MSELEELISNLEGSGEEQKIKLAQLFPLERIRKLQREERRRFTESQDRKWVNWLLAMLE